MTQLQLRTGVVSSEVKAVMGGGGGGVFLGGAGERMQEGTRLFGKVDLETKIRRGVFQKIEIRYCI